MAVSDRELNEMLNQLRQEKVPDGEQPNPDGEQPNPDGEQPKPDGEQPKPDGEQPNPDGEQPNPDGEQPNPDSEQPNPDSEQPNPDSEQPNPDSEQPNPDGEQPNPDSEQPKPEGEQPKPEAVQPESGTIPDVVPLKPKRGSVAVSVIRQQRRRAAGKQSAKTVPVRRQAADASKGQRRIYDVPVPDTSASPQRTLRDAGIGVVLLLFACIGVCTLIRLGIRTVSERRSAQNAAVTQCILPLCVMDMPSFEKPDDLTDEQFLTAAVWAMITDGRLADYPTDTNLCTVPAADVTAAGNARFGTARSPQYRTVGFSDALRFYYDADQDSFLLPSDPRYFGNLPEVQSCTEQNGLYTVTAVCRPEQPSWYQTEAPVVRHSEFILKQERGVWQIVSLHTDVPDAQNNEETEPTDEQEND